MIYPMLLSQFERVEMMKASETPIFQQLRRIGRTSRRTAVEHAQNIIAFALHNLFPVNHEARPVLRGTARSIWEIHSKWRRRTMRGPVFPGIMPSIRNAKYNGSCSCHDSYPPGTRALPSGILPPSVATHSITAELKCNTSHGRSRSSTSPTKACTHMGRRVGVILQGVTELVSRTDPM